MGCAIAIVSGYATPLIVHRLKPPSAVLSLAKTMPETWSGCAAACDAPNTVWSHVQAGFCHSGRRYPHLYRRLIFIAGLSVIPRPRLAIACDDVSVQFALRAHRAERS